MDDDNGERDDDEWLMRGMAMVARGADILCPPTSKFPPFPYQYLSAPLNDGERDDDEWVMRGMAMVARGADSSLP